MLLLPVSCCQAGFSYPGAGLPRGYPSAKSLRPGASISLFSCHRPRPAVVAFFISPFKPCARTGCPTSATTCWLASSALAILILLAQLPDLTNVTWHVYAMTAGGLAVIYGFPYTTKSVPSPLVTSVVPTAVAMFLNMDIRTVGDMGDMGDMGDLPDDLPMFLIPEIPLSLDTLLIIFPYSLTLMVVGLLESLMTATIVDDLTDTKGDKDRECVDQGVANIASGFFFAHTVGQILRVRSTSEDDGCARRYLVTGQVLFATVGRFANAFDYKEVSDRVSIDVRRAHFWDITAVSALDKVVLKFRREGTKVEVIGLNAASATLVDKFGVHNNKDGTADLLLGH